MRQSWSAMGRLLPKSFFWGPSLCRTVSGNGDDVLVIGKVGPGRTAKAVTQAVISKVKDEHPEAPGILPTYALSGSLTQKMCVLLCAKPCFLQSTISLNACLIGS